MPRSICKNTEKIDAICKVLSKTEDRRTAVIVAKTGYDHHTVVTYLLMLQRRNKVIRTDIPMKCGKVGRAFLWRLAA
jgi:hypothetical protein